MSSAKSIRAPALSSRLTTATCPFQTAYTSGVRPYISTESTWAPFLNGSLMPFKRPPMPLINSLTTTSNPFPAAQDIADRPYVPSFEFKSIVSNLSRCFTTAVSPKYGCNHEAGKLLREVCVCARPINPKPSQATL